MKVNRVSYLHYVVLFAFALIAVTVGITLWMTYQQALVVYELNSARRLQAVGQTVALQLDPATVRSLTPVDPAVGMKNRPQDPVSTYLEQVASANDLMADDGGSISLHQVPADGAAGYPVVASAKGFAHSQWLLGHGPNLIKSESTETREDDKLLGKVRAALQNTERGVIRGQQGNYVGEPGIWPAAVVPLNMDPAQPTQVTHMLLLSANSDYHADLAHFPFTDLLPVVVVVFLVVAALSIFFAGHIISAIWTVLKAHRKLTEGKMDYRLSRRRNDEFGLLFRSFNNLADNLEVRDDESKRFRRILGEALNSSGAPLAVCLPSGALVFASQSALDLLGLPADCLPTEPQSKPISLLSRMATSPEEEVAGAPVLEPLDFPALESMPQDQPEMDMEAVWLPAPIKDNRIDDVPKGAKVAEFSIVALTRQEAKSDEADQLDGYLLIFKSIADLPAVSDDSADLPADSDDIADAAADAEEPAVHADSVG